MVSPDSLTTVHLASVRTLPYMSLISPLMMISWPRSFIREPTINSGFSTYAKSGDSILVFQNGKRGTYLYTFPFSTLTFCPTFPPLN